MGHSCLAISEEKDLPSVIQGRNSTRKRKNCVGRRNIDSFWPTRYGVDWKRTNRKRRKRPEMTRKFVTTLLVEYDNERHNPFISYWIRMVFHHVYELRWLKMCLTTDASFALSTTDWPMRAPAWKQARCQRNNMKLEVCRREANKRGKIIDYNRPNVFLLSPYTVWEFFGYLQIISKGGEFYRQAAQRSLHLLRLWAVSLRLSNQQHSWSIEPQPGRREAPTEARAEAKFPIPLH